MPATRHAYGCNPPCLWLQLTLTVSSAYAEAGARGGSAGAGATMAAGGTIAADASVAVGMSAASSSAGEAVSDGDGGIGLPLGVHLSC